METRRILEENLVFRLSIGCIIAGAVFLRCLVALSPYSGQGASPMFGDFEAQRHWMEITTQLPIDEWYKNTTNNNLQYWGLDYPPLTAYFSWVCGKIAQLIGCGNIVSLNTSRGIETLYTKLFMRSTAIISDILFFFIPAIFFCLNFHKSNREKQLKSLALLLLSPGLILIDHGHFQYNSVSLGLSLIGITLIFSGHDLFGSIAFVCSLCYKQMLLYFAPAFFFYLLGKCITTSSTWLVSFKRVSQLGITVILTFLVICIPFLIKIDSLFDMLHRIFPVSRGLFEDKVANLWCAILPLIKLKRLFSQNILVSMSAILTLLGIIPTTLLLKSRGSKPVFIQGLAISGFSFFLFSYQVHEKTILIPLLPISLLALDYPSLSCFLNLVSCFSMFPLLLRDHLLIPYFVLTAAYFIACVILAEPRRTKLLTFWFIFANFIHFLHLVLPTPTRYPDIFAMIYVGISFICFGWSYCLFSFRLYNAISSSKQHNL